MTHAHGPKAEDGWNSADIYQHTVGMKGNAIFGPDELDQIEMPPEEGMRARINLSPLPDFVLEARRKRLMALGAAVGGALLFWPVFWLVVTG